MILEGNLVQKVNQVSSCNQVGGSKKRGIHKLLQELGGERKREKRKKEREECNDPARQWGRDKMQGGGNKGYITLKRSLTRTCVSMYYYIRYYLIITYYYESG